MDSNSKLILGIMGAAAAGVAVGILLAPSSGEDLRRKVLDSFDELGDKIADLVQAQIDQAKSVTREIKDDVKTLAADVKQTTQDAKDIVS